MLRSHELDNTNSIHCIMYIRPGKEWDLVWPDRGLQACWLFENFLDFEWLPVSLTRCKIWMTKMYVGWGGGAMTSPGLGGEGSSLYFLAVLSEACGFKPWVIKQSSELDYSSKRISTGNATPQTRLHMCRSSSLERRKVTGAELQRIVKYAKEYCSWSPETAIQL